MWWGGMIWCSSLLEAPAPKLPKLPLRIYLDLHDKVRKHQHQHLHLNLQRQETWLGVLCCPPAYLRRVWDCTEASITTFDKMLLIRVQIAALVAAALVAAAHGTKCG